MLTADLGVRMGSQYGPRWRSLPTNDVGRYVPMVLHDFAVETFRLKGITRMIRLQMVDQGVVLKDAPP